MSVLEMKYALLHTKCLLHSWSTNVVALNLSPFPLSHTFPPRLPLTLLLSDWLWLTPHPPSDLILFSHSLSHGVLTEKKSPGVVMPVWCRGRWDLCFSKFNLGCILSAKSLKNKVGLILKMNCMFVWKAVNASTCTLWLRYPPVPSCLQLFLSPYTSVVLLWPPAHQQITLFFNSPVRVQSARVHRAWLPSGSDPGHGCRHWRECSDGLQDHRERRPWCVRHHY